MASLDWLPEGLREWLPLLGTALVAVLVAHLAFRIGQRIVLHALRRSEFALTVAREIRPPARLLLPLVALNLVWHGAPADVNGLSLVQHYTGILLIAALAWLALKILAGIERAIVQAHPATVADNLQARRIHTQARALAKTLEALVLIVAGAMILMTFPGVRQIGASLLASAGLVGIVAGFAARPVLGNMIAGLQIGLTQPIRLDDVVIVQGEWGVIEEITGAYVVVKIWDQRRLVVPLQWWIENPFQNWTRSTSELIGTVFLWVDYRMPLAPLREQLQLACEASKDWDGRLALLQVFEAGERCMQLRALVTAADAGRAWDLRCHVREWLIDYIQREHPDCLPRLRAELEGEKAGPGPAAAAPRHPGEPG
ncbi:mechanosensitive ion channel family protein [Caldimonas tepidiphila]|uniref:mechanosensitive ion channel family protein n=1 Tax=Caldimonas tepidiphila TaxID=2315841 RepID=UPI000E5B0D7B|nr:mechanosensitive ion channel domain-containing protein [Caldimonas tepidiphila]